MPFPRCTRRLLAIFPLADAPFLESRFVFRVFTYGNFVLFTCLHCLGCHPLIPLIVSCATEHGGGAFFPFDLICCREAVMAHPCPCRRSIALGLSNLLGYVC